MDQARAFQAHDLDRLVVKEARRQETVFPAHGSLARGRGPFHQGQRPDASARNSLIQPARQAPAREVGLRPCR